MTTLDKAFYAGLILGAVLSAALIVLFKGL